MQAVPAVVEVGTYFAMRRILLICLAGFAALAAPAQAAKTCSEPGEDWQRATPAEVGMDAAKMQEAIDYGSTQESFAIRVYRHGCLVGEDRLAAANRDTQYESYSMAKSVTSLIFGRAMTMRHVSPDDLVGSLVPEADAKHGAISMHDLLTMTSGLRWNGFRDYNIFTMPDRVRDALTLETVKKPGTYFEYAQSAVALLAEATGRATGEDFQHFGQRELMNRIGIPADEWRWVRDPAGHVMGFYGVNMKADDFGRLGDLLRRGGVWNGKRLLSRAYVENAVAASATNGCYGWLIWVNAAAPCIGPTVADRPVEEGRDFPDLPADMWNFSGLFGQRVTLFPTQDLMIVRTGQDPGLVPGPGASWEHDLYVKLLASVTDQKIEPPGEPPRVRDERPDKDYGFGNSLAEPDQYNKGAVQDPLPPAGPRRARAPQLGLASRRASRTGGVAVRVFCPLISPGSEPRSCVGRAKLTGTRSAAYEIAPGTTKRLRLRLDRRALASLRSKGSATLTLRARNTDAAGGVPASTSITVLAPRE